MEQKMFITRVALLSDGICVWFGKEPRHYEENYYADHITYLGENGTYDTNTVWGNIKHLSEKNWWNTELEAQMIMECQRIIGLVGKIII